MESMHNKELDRMLDEEQKSLQDNGHKNESSVSVSSDSSSESSPRSPQSAKREDSSLELYKRSPMCHKPESSRHNFDEEEENELPTHVTQENVFKDSGVLK